MGLLDHQRRQREADLVQYNDQLMARNLALTVERDALAAELARARGLPALLRSNLDNPATAGVWTAAERAGARAALYEMDHRLATPATPPTDTIPDLDEDEAERLADSIMWGDG